MKIVFDSSSLILLIEKLKLRDLFIRCREMRMELILPNAVWSEFAEKNNDYDTLSFIKENFKIVETDVCEVFDRLLDDDSGELAVASLSKEFHDDKINYFCIIDEKYGSKICKLEGLNVMGSIGFLLFLKERGMVSSNELCEIKCKIQKSNFRITKEHLDKLCLVFLPIHPLFFRYKNAKT